MILSVTFDRTALGLDPLVIGQLPTASVPLWLPEDGLTEPDFNFRILYAEESAYLPGRQALAAVLDAASLPLVVKATGTSGTALRAAKALLEAAASQWAYEVTVNIDGATQTFPADPAWPTWGAVDSGAVKGGIATCSLSIPVNPPGA